MDISTALCSSDVSQTALALLVLLARGKPLGPAVIKTLLENHADTEDSLHLTVFSDHNEENWGDEPPVIIPFVGRKHENRSHSNAYGALPLRDGVSKKRNEKRNETGLRIFSPDTDDHASESPFFAASATTSCTLRVYEPQF